MQDVRLATRGQEAADIGVAMPLLSHMPTAALEAADTSMAAKKRRATRCNECASCLNPKWKKGCLQPLSVVAASPTKRTRSRRSSDRVAPNPV